MIGVKRFLVFFVLFLTLVSIAALAVERDCMFYFYGEGCEQCDEANSYMNKLMVKHIELKIEKFEVYHHRENAELLQKYFQQNGISKDSQGIPAVFMRGSYFIGDDAIQSLLDGTIKENDNTLCPSLEEDSFSVGVVGERTTQNVLETISTLEVTAGGFKDGIKLNMIALFLVFIIFLSFERNWKKIIPQGAIFIGVLYAVNILFGAGFLAEIANSSFATYFYKVIGFLAVIYGILSIYLFLRNQPYLLSKESREKLKERTEFFTTPGGALLFGFIAAFFSLSLRSDAFKLLQRISLGDLFPLAVMPLIFYYTMILVLPFIILLTGYYYTKKNLHAKAEKKAEGIDHKIKIWNEHHHKILTFLVSVIVLVVGLVLMIV